MSPSIRPLPLPSSSPSSRCTAMSASLTLPEDPCPQLDPAMHMDTPPTPVSNSSGSLSPEPGLEDPISQQQQKKKKKKKTKKPKAKGAPTANARTTDDERPPVLCISRNKHWRYISSYHVRVSSIPIEALTLTCSRLHLYVGPVVATTSRATRVSARAQSRPSHSISSRDSSTTPSLSHVLHPDPSPTRPRLC